MSANKQSKRKTRRRQPAARIDPRPLDVGELPSVNEPAVYTIEQFCEQHDISISMFHKMKDLGIAPEIMRVGARRMISVEAAARWRAARERYAAA